MHHDKPPVLTPQRNYRAFFGNIIGGAATPERPESMGHDVPTHRAAVQRDLTAALAAWLDSLPDSPQGATIAGRLSKLRDRWAANVATNAAKVP